LSRCDPSDKLAITSWMRAHGLLEGGGSAAGNASRRPAPKSANPTPRHNATSPIGLSPAAARSLALPGKKITASYPYTDSEGHELFVKVRYDPKDFRIARPGSGGAYMFGSEGIAPVLFRLPAVERADQVLLVEGEKDVLTAERLGFTATTKTHGASSSIDHSVDSLRGKAVVICYDNDDAGRAAVARDADRLRGVAASRKIITVPHGKDLTEWVNGGGTGEELRRLIEQAPELKLPNRSVEKHEHIPDAAQPLRPTQRRDIYPPLPEAAWFSLSRTYRDAVGHTTEASDAYHLAGFLTAAGVALGRSVFVLMPHEVYPNIFVALVGQSGKARKGTAMRYAAKLAKAVVPDLVDLAGIDSPEGFIDKLAKRQEGCPPSASVTCLIRYPELRALADKAAREGTRGIVPVLSLAYDTERTIEINTRHNDRSVSHTFTALIGGASPSWLDKLSPADLAGGLGNRICWVPGEPKAPIPWPPPLDADRWEETVKLLGKARAHWLQQGTTEIRFAPDAQKRWAAFYNEQARGARENDFIAGLADRLELHAVKVAMIHAAVSGSSSIELAHLDPAIAWADFLHLSLYAVFSEFGLPYLKKVERRIIAQVDKARGGEVRRRLVQQRLSDVSGEIFNRALRWITGDDGELREERRGNSLWLIRNAASPQAQSEKGEDEG
jgi:hypothetical protein